jgi:ribosomal protein L34E
MTKAQYRSGSWNKKKVKRKGEIKILYKRKRVQKSRCVCGRPLPGVKQDGPATKKRVSRPFGGHFCAKCAKRMIIESARGAK